MPNMPSGEAQTLRCGENAALGSVVLGGVGRRNSLGNADHATLMASLTGWSRSPDIYAVMMRSTLRGVFSTGTDLRELATAAKSGAGAAADLCRPMYELYWRVECFTKPLISFIDGHCAGAAHGMVLFGTHRVGGVDCRLAFPEVGLGLVPQAGAIHALGRLPDNIGLYLALTGRGVSRADALALGLLTHTIDGPVHDDVGRRLGNAEPVDPILDGLQRDPGPRDLDLFQGLIAECFSLPTVEEIVERLLRQTGGLKPWAEQVVRGLLRNSPLALKATHRLMLAARGQGLRETLIATHSVVANLAAGEDFREGLRAAVVDNDRAPRWRRSALGDISDQAVEAVFSLPAGKELLLNQQNEPNLPRI